MIFLLWSFFCANQDLSRFWSLVRFYISSGGADVAIMPNALPGVWKV
jgi:hypothetical protein